MSTTAIIFAVMWAVTLYCLGRTQDENLRLFEKVHKYIIDAAVARMDLANAQKSILDKQSIIAELSKQLREQKAKQV